MLDGNGGHKMGGWCPLPRSPCSAIYPPLCSALYTLLLTRSKMALQSMCVVMLRDRALFCNGL